MIADEQTHKLPENDADRRRIAALSGDATCAGFDARVGRLLKAVNRRYGELFAEAEDLSSRFGSLVFTGVEDDPETLRTLARMGFSDPPRVVGDDPGLAPRPHRRDPHRGRARAVHPPGAAPSGGRPRHRRAGHRLPALRRLLRAA